MLVGNSMGGVLGILHAAVEPESLAGLVLTSSPFPWVRGALPPSRRDRAGSRPTTLPASARWSSRPACAASSAERAVRLGLRLVAADPRSIPDEVVQLMVDQMKERALDPDAPAAFQDAWRSLRRLGQRPDVAEGRWTVSVARCSCCTADATDWFPPPMPRPHCGRTPRGEVASSPISATCRRWRPRADGSPRSRTGTPRRTADSGPRPRPPPSPARRSRSRCRARARRRRDRVPVGGEAERHRSGETRARDREAAALPERHRGIARDERRAREVQRHLRRRHVRDHEVEPAPRLASRAAIACRAGGAYAPSPMIESAPTAIEDSFSWAVARRTRCSRVPARSGPTGTSTNAGATRLPTSPCSAFERTDTGTMTPQRAAARRARLDARADRAGRPATAVSTTSFTVPPRACLISRIRVERRLGHREPSRRADLVSNGPAGGGAHVHDVAHPARASRRPPRTYGRGRPRRDRSPRAGAARDPAAASRNRSSRVGRRLGRPRPRRRGADLGVGSEVEQRGSDRHARDAVGERMMQLHEHGRAALREALEDVQLPQRLRRDRADARARVRLRAPVGSARRASGSPNAADGSRGRTGRRRPRAGRASPNGTRITRCRSRGARCNRASTPAARRHRSAARRREGRTRRAPATCICTAGRLQVQEARVEARESFGRHRDEGTPRRGRPTRGCYGASIARGTANRPIA